jgi:hypothetical protein
VQAQNYLAHQHQQQQQQKQQKQQQEANTYTAHAWRGRGGSDVWDAAGGHLAAPGMHPAHLAGVPHQPLGALGGHRGMQWATQCSLHVTRSSAPGQQGVQQQATPFARAENQPAGCAGGAQRQLGGVEARVLLRCMTNSRVDKAASIDFAPVHPHPRARLARSHNVSRGPLHQPSPRTPWPPLPAYAHSGRWRNRPCTRPGWRVRVSGNGATGPGEWQWAAALHRRG